MGAVPLEVDHHFTDRLSVNLEVVPAATVWGLFAATLPEHLQQGSIRTPTLAGSSIKTLIILNPEGNVPGLPVCPTVIGVGGHRFSLLVDVISLQGQRGGTAPDCATRRGGRTVPGMKGRCERVTRRSDRSLPYALPPLGWGTTGSATRTHYRGSGSELRFS